MPSEWAERAAEKLSHDWASEDIVPVVLPLLQQIERDEEARERNPRSPHGHDNVSDPLHCMSCAARESLRALKASLGVE